MSDINFGHYIIDEENKKITGFYTVAEWSAYELGRQHQENVTMKFIEDWDGSTNSVMGQLLFKKLISSA